MSAKRRVAGEVLSLAVLTVVILLLARPSADPAHVRPMLLIAVAWIAFGCAAWLVRKIAVRLAVAIILIGGIAVQVVALSGPPQDGSHLYRYGWDGRVQAAGISTTPMQAAAALCAVVVTLILLFGLRASGKDVRLAALWAWCPTVALEAGQNGRVDVVGVALTAGALLLLARAKTERRTALGGLLIGLAIAVSVTPALVLPAVLRRGWWLISASAALAIGLVYVPHALAPGNKVFGFFPGYLHQAGYSTGTGSGVIGLVVHGKPAAAAAVVLLGLVALAILRYCDPDQPWRGSAVMTAAALAIAAPQFPWYAILLVMLVALDGRPEWLAIAAGGYLADNPDLGIDRITLHDPRVAGYDGGAAIAFAIAIVGYVLARRSRPVPAEQEPRPEPGPAEPGPASEAVTADTTRAVARAEASPTVAAKDALPTAGAPPSVLVTIGADGRPMFGTADQA
jgi:Glycosyltransferase family 87